MTVPAPTRQRRSSKGARSSPLLFPVALIGTALGAGGATVMAPAGARPWVLGTAAAAWVCLATVSVAASVLLRRALGHAAARAGELEMNRNNWAQQGAEAAHLVNTVLPALVSRLKSGTGADEALSGAPSLSDPHLRRVLHVFATEMG